jgi:hypothetical protein
MPRKSKSNVEILADLQDIINNLSYAAEELEYGRQVKAHSSIRHVIGLVQATKDKLK